MAVGDYLILIQNILLALVMGGSWILCKKNNKKKPAGIGLTSPSNETLMVASAIKPPVTDTTPSMLGPPKSEAAKKEEPTKPEEEKKMDNKDSKDSNEKEKGEKKEEEKKEKSKKESSQKAFPTFQMPTESKRNKKMQANDQDKHEKIKQGFYQEKSDNDDTLEKIDSLKVEQSDRTKRSQKNKKKG